MSTPAKSGAAEAVLSGVTGLLEKQTDAIKEYMTIRFQELEVELKEVKNMLQALQKVSSGAKKATKVADSAEGAAASTASGAAPAASTAAKPAITNNSLLWFKQRYTASEEFRNKYTTAAMRTTLAEDKSIKGTGEARTKAEAGKAWNLLKELEAKHTDTSTKSLMALFKEEFEQAKKDASAAPAQQNAEPSTP